MYYTEHFEVSSHDVDRFDVARPGSVLRYMQETANHQMRDQKPSYMDLFREGKAFLLSRMAVTTHLPLHSYDKIDVQTWPVVSRGATFDRCYRIERGGQCVAEGQAVWALVDVNTHKLYRVTDVDLSNYVHGPLVPVPGLRFQTPDGMPRVGEHTVAYYETDVNSHLNNTVYPDLLLDFLPAHDGRTVADFSIHFRAEARLHETLSFYRSDPEDTPAGQRLCFRTARADGTPNIDAQVILRTL